MSEAVVPARSIADPISVLEQGYTVLVALMAAVPVVCI